MYDYTRPQFTRVESSITHCERWLPFYLFGFSLAAIVAIVWLLTLGPPGECVVEQGDPRYKCVSGDPQRLTVANFRLQPVKVYWINDENEEML